MVIPGERYGKWALVAGAAEGIGEGFTTVLAGLGFNVILADRQGDAMRKLAARIRADHRVETTELEIDLGSRDAAARLLEAAMHHDCRLLLYVAAWSRVQRFVTLTAADLDGFCAVNIHTLLHCVHGFSKRLSDEGKPGGILLVSSLAGLIGPQYVATYAATKAFSIRLSEGLFTEFKEKGIDITTVCSGTVSTPTYLDSNPRFDRLKPPFEEPAQVARYAMRMLGKKPVCISGKVNRLQFFFLQSIIPLRMARRLVNSAMEKMYGKL